MDLKRGFLYRYKAIYGYYLNCLYEELNKDELISRPHPSVNPVLWVLWHVARSEASIANFKKYSSQVGLFPINQPFLILLILIFIISILPKKLNNGK